MLWTVEPRARGVHLRGSSRSTLHMSQETHTEQSTFCSLGQITMSGSFSSAGRVPESSRAGKAVAGYDSGKGRARVGLGHNAG